MKSRLIATIVAAVLLWACPASATYYTHIYDWVTLGESGHAIQGASVYVYDHADSSAHTVYSDMDTTAITQPIATDADGFYEFYIEPEADVFLRIYKSSLAIDDTLRHVVPRFSASNYDTLAVAHIDTAHVETGRFDYIAGKYDNRYNTSNCPAPVDSLRSWYIWPNYMMIPYHRSMTFMRNNSGATDHLGGAATILMSLGAESMEFRNSCWISWQTPIIHSSGGTGDAMTYPLVTYDRSATVGDTLYAKYDDNGIVGFQHSGGDSTGFAQTVRFSNARDDTTQWGYFGYVSNDDCTVLRNSYTMTPNKAFAVESDLPDSNGVGGEKTVLEIKRIGDTAATGGWLNPESSYLDLMDGGQTKYAFQRDFLKLYSDGNRDNSKDIPLTVGWYDGAADYDSDDSTLKCYIVPSSNYTDLGLHAPTGRPVRIYDVLAQPEWSAALPDTATALLYGEGHMFYRDINAADAGTLFIWDDDAVTYRAWISDGTADAN